MTVHTKENPPEGFEEIAAKARAQDSTDIKFWGLVSMCHPANAEEHAEYLLALERKIEKLEQQVNSLQASNWPGEPGR